MIPDETPPAAGSVYGHNSGSMLENARSEQAASLHDTIRDGKTWAQRRSEFLASAAAQTVTDRRTAADAADTMKLAGEVWDMIDADRKARSDPFRATHLALSAMATEFWEPVNEAMRGLRGGIDAWTAEEDDRIAAQVAEQEAEMARRRAAVAPVKPAPAPAPRPAGRAHIDYAAPAAPAPTPAMAAMRPTKRAKIRGDLGSTISQRDVQNYEIEDISLIPDHIMNSTTVHQAILTVVKSTVRHMGVPAGIRVISATGNQIR